MAEKKDQPATDNSADMLMQLFNHLIDSSRQTVPLARHQRNYEYPEVEADKDYIVLFQKRNIDKKGKLAAGWEHNYNTKIVKNKIASIYMRKLEAGDPRIIAIHPLEEFKKDWEKKTKK